MRSWISATISLASVVMTAKVRIHSPEAGSFQFSHRPPIDSVGVAGRRALGAYQAGVYEALAEASINPN